MKKIFILLLCLPIYSYSQNQLDNYIGKWEEISRTQKNKIQDFEDTIRIEFQQGNYTIIRYDNGPTLIGNAKFEGEQFTLRTKQFQIEKESAEEITLVESKVKHKMHQVNEFRSSPIHRKNPSLENERKVQIKNQDMSGKWTCYKKTDSLYSKTRFYIKAINLKTKLSESEYIGTISYQNMDSVYMKDITCIIDKNLITVISNQSKILYKIEMLFNNEMILKEDSAIFYLKLLGK